MFPVISRFHLATRPKNLLRRLSTPSSPAIQNSVFISRSTDPLFNLTFEDWLFRHSPPDKPLLFLYRNTPCVVIGRNQNPWKEVNMGALRARGVPLVRRRSGGGTVYHDLGNMNFSIHLARQAFDRHATAQLVLRAVRAMGIARACLNDRNDLCVGPDKVSGSAYKIVSARAYHHGTMLIATQLDTLGDLLHTETDTMVTAGVASVRSPVCNLQQSSPATDHTAFARAVVREFRAEYALDETADPTQTIDETAGDPAYIQRGIAELQSWDWLYGQTPAFTYTLKRAFPWGAVTAEVRAKHGVILSCALRAPGLPPDTLAPLSASAESARYGAWPKAEAEGTPRDGPAGDVERWLGAVLR
ncbi:Lipoyltransferase and lipoate-protein ligase [Mycena rosella]|uniref:Putative lipoate-protein ligase A n=1 Tax=Mycena rosella TaxID=1033263 RepID=A0AAD7BQT7_MYCRO|nr:Lipoyltransferase and lipoate-protein ligase [Mycena rosella]